MNLPLQMRAVSRGRFQQSRIVSSAGRVRPSWRFVCDRIACSCPDGSVACCDSESDCSCGNIGGTGNGPAGCTGELWGLFQAGHMHQGGAVGKCNEHHEPISCIAGEFTCYDANGNQGACN
jgi:hypothetical protein